MVRRRRDGGIREGVFVCSINKGIRERRVYGKDKGV